MRLQFEPEKNLKAVLVTQSCLTLCDPMDCSHQAPLSIEFSRQKYWSGLPFLSPGALPDTGIELRSPALRADSLSSEPLGKHNSPLFRDFTSAAKLLQSCLSLKA